ncbi:hypothetical protein MPTK1_7g09380 [Marchantia polymorpha subsp. ruderalis]|uniref:Uncharacterized protein n=2 Tax=Marchantia polymorpha TaxID=3197 RepID=A0AAF6BXR6_MARPO|nr:hypothetical protein MARPO_0068s0091 [Marchantia polymorpha]BBN16800.1 hypothetical protein Mp_7g09380 [Marchantia polymorpha subsp. ruderalis]|eukprot:PTQ35883.1 hypothetical protein MARPO_0068s0091 [Marchantia polymorpha]
MSTYYFSITIRPLYADLPDVQLQRLSLYYTLYDAVFGVVGVLAILLLRFTRLVGTPILPCLIVLDELSLSYSSC